MRAAKRKRSPQAKAVVRAEAARVARQVAIRVAAELKQLHRDELMKEIAQVIKLLDKKNASDGKMFAAIFKRLEAGDKTFESHGLQLRGLTDSINGFPTVLTSAIQKQTAAITRVIEDRIGTVEAQQNAVRKSLDQAGEIADAIQGFGKLAILLERAEVAVMALEKRQGTAA